MPKPYVKQSGDGRRHERNRRGVAPQRAAPRDHAGDTEKERAKCGEKGKKVEPEVEIG